MESCIPFKITLCYRLLTLLTTLLLPLSPVTSTTELAPPLFHHDTRYPDTRYHDNNQHVINKRDVMITCDNATVANGAVYMTRDGQLRDRIIVQCYEGYQMEGHPQVNCEEGDIAHLLPSCREVEKCRVECGMDHGSCVHHTTGDLVDPGVEVHYLCDETYSFSTTYSTIMCTAQDGVFDRSLPTCFTQIQGIPCSLTESEAVSNFLEPSAAQTIQSGQSIQVVCQHGYHPREHNGPVTITCTEEGNFDRELSDLCSFVGVDFSLDYTAERTIKQNEDKINLDKGVGVRLKCAAHSLTNDGLPLPEVTWQIPPKLLAQKHQNKDGTVSVSHIEGVKTDYKVRYRFDVTTGDFVHQAEATLSIESTMEVHSGTYSCMVKLVDFAQSKSKTLQVKSDFTPAMWLLLIVPVVMFVAVHCFYRKAVRNGRHPFQNSSKMAKDIMQEVDKRKKLEELNLQYYSSGGKNIKPTAAQSDKQQPRSRRGAVIDV